MSEQHYMERCEHGTVAGQCRCPSKDKSVRIVPCPPYCPKAKAPEPERGPGCLPECMPGGYLHAIKCKNASWNKPEAKAPEPVKHLAIVVPDFTAAILASKPAPQAEEPIDWDAADSWAETWKETQRVTPYTNIPKVLHAARAYLALKSENAALRAEVELKR